MTTVAELIHPRGPNRLLLEATLDPVQGRRFQPTGFPDLGPALFAGGKKLLVESAQSMANRLEAVCWDEVEQTPIPVLKGLSYVEVRDNKDRMVTSSMLEAHRLNSAYILDDKNTMRAGTNVVFFKQFSDEANEIFPDKIITRQSLARLVFRYDVGALLHGVFLERNKLMGGRMRIERALSAFIEADDVTIATSGGVKNDRVASSGDSTAGTGNVIFSRDEFIAESITAYFNLDLRQLRAYGLPAPATEFLVTLALFKIRALLDNNLRLRTACDLEVRGEPEIKRPSGCVLPSYEALSAELPGLIKACAPLFAEPDGRVRVMYTAPKK